MSTSISLPVLDDSMDVRFGASYAGRRKLRMIFHEKHIMPAPKEKEVLLQNIDRKKVLSPLEQNTIVKTRTEFPEA